MIQYKNRLVKGSYAMHRLMNKKRKGYLMNSMCFNQIFPNFCTVGIELFSYDCLYLLEKWCAVAFKLDFYTS